MRFLKNPFGEKKSPTVEPAPTQEEFDEADARLRQAIDESPHKATADIANMATALLDLYSKSANTYRAQGDANAFIFAVGQGAGIYAMAAEASYQIGCTKNAIDALRMGLAYVNEALAASSTSVHFASISLERERMEALLKDYEQVQRQAEEAVEQFCMDLRMAAVELSNNGDPVWNMRGLRQYIMALAEAVSGLVYCIIVPGSFGPYIDIWKQEVVAFWELASFLGYYLGIHTLTEAQDAKNKGDIILPIVATIWQPNERTHRMIERYHDLMRNPQEMKDRHILWAHTNSSEDQARGVVYEYIVNELVHGPDLGGQLDDPHRLDPADSLYLKVYLQNTLIERIKVLRPIAARL